jgi:hypothetical protein
MLLSTRSYTFSAGVLHGSGTHKKLLQTDNHANNIEPQNPLRRKSQLEKERKMRLSTSHVLKIGSEGSNAGFTFELAKVRMTRRQAEIVRKLFVQDPVAEVAEGPHAYSKERGKTGPASKYLSRSEFEAIRTIGVRLGTRGELAATACDFCLHCVKLEALNAAGRRIR